MEWLDGFTLAEIHRAQGEDPCAGVRSSAICAWASRASTRTAIHATFKPSNAHLGFDAVTRALELGAAKSRRPTSPHQHRVPGRDAPFMAPEQLDNTMPIDHRADCGPLPSCSTS